MDCSLCCPKPCSSRYDERAVGTGRLCGDAASDRSSYMGASGSVEILVPDSEVEEALEIIASSFGN